MSVSIAVALNAHTNHVLPKELHRVLSAISRMEKGHKGSIDKLVADNAAQKTTIDALVADLSALRSRQAAMITELTALKDKLNADAGVTDANYAFTDTAPEDLTAAATADLTAMVTPPVELKE